MTVVTHIDLGEVAVGSTHGYQDFQLAMSRSSETIEAGVPTMKEWNFICSFLIEYHLQIMVFHTSISSASISKSIDVGLVRFE